jgi:hypothetical protein
MSKITIPISMALAMLVSISPVMAGFSDGCSVTMGGKPVFQILGSSHGFAPEHRAWLAQDALDNALVLADNLSPSAVRVDRVNGAVVVMIDNQVVATADSESARLENMTSNELAQKWADAIKAFLSDQSQTEKYIATLTGKNPVEASVAIAERRLYAPAGLTFTVRLSRELAAGSLKEGEIVEAVLDRDVMLGHFVIPAESKVIGELVQIGPNDFNICFTSLRTPIGTEMPIKAMATTNYVIAIDGPHTVSTYAIPAGSVIGVPEIVGRIPARVGIGVPDTKQYLVMNRQAGFLAANQPLTLIFEDTTPVAVIHRDITM